MKTYILIVLIVASNLFSTHTFAQDSQTSKVQTADNSFGILELFDGIRLYHNRSYAKEYNFTNHVPFNEAEKLQINKSRDGKSVTITQGSWLQVTIYKTKTPGVYNHSKRFSYQISKYRYSGKVESIKFLNNGALQINVKNRNSIVLDIAGLGLKLSSENNIAYYETEDEHKKSSLEDFQRPRIISLGETINAWDSAFRFAAIEGTLIKITAVNHEKNIGNAYVTLYGINGEVVKRVEGKDAFSLTHKIPETGFYYISTMKDDKSFVKITLTEE